MQLDYTLTLTPDKATIEPGKSYTFTATVTNQDGSPPSQTVAVAVKVEVDPTSGGHSHGGSGRPKGSILPTSGSNTLPFNFTSTEVSGIHTITATCDRCVNRTATAKVDVVVKEAVNNGFTEVTANTDLYAVIDSKGQVVGATQHSNNHCLTPAAVGKLKSFAKAYNTTINPGQRLYLNDASEVCLMWAARIGSLRTKVIDEVQRLMFAQRQRLTVRQSRKGQFHLICSGRFGMKQSAKE